MESPTADAPSAETSAHSASEMEGLKANRDRILAEKKKLKSELDILRAQLNGIAPNEAEAAIKENRSLRDQLAKMQGQQQAVVNQLNQAELRGYLHNLSLEKGAHFNALPDIYQRSTQFQWRRADTTYEAYDFQNQPVLTESGQSYTLRDWIADLGREAPHLFKNSSGGGVAGQASPKAANTAGSRYYDLHDVASGRVIMQ